MKSDLTHTVKAKAVALLMFIEVLQGKTAAAMFELIAKISSGEGDGSCILMNRRRSMIDWLQ
jgi:hypothetical protein